tara:strand:+ start:117 stop:500 length:384 start_codon:yes stop_codon:yes gene_type:complete
MFYEYLFIILFGSLAHRGLHGVGIMQSQGQFARLSYYLSLPGGFIFVSFSRIILIILAFLNGYILDGFKGMLIVGISTTFFYLVILSWTVDQIYALSRNLHLKHPSELGIFWTSYFIYSVIKIIRFF